MRRPVVQWHGARSADFTWPDDGVALGVRQLREERGDVWAELTPAVDIGTAEQGQLRAPSKVNLSTTRGRDEFAKAVNARYDAFDWHTAIDAVAALAVEGFRRGAPIIDLSTVTAPADTPYLLRPVLQKNATTVIFGPGGIGKSTLADAFAFHCRLGRHLPGMETTEQTGVLILDWEATEIAHARNLAALAAGHDLQGVPGVHYRQCTRPIADEADDIAAEVSRLGVGLVIIDSLAPATGDDPNAPGAATRTMNAIRSLGSSRLILAHVTKEAANGNSMASIFGSVFFTNLARSVWELRGVGDEENEAVTTLGLFHRKTNEGPLHRRPIGLRFIRQPGMLRIESADIDLDSPLSAGMSIAQRLRLALREGAATVDQLAEEIDAKGDTVRGALHRMPDAIKLEGGAGGRGKVALWGLRAHGEPTPSPSLTCSRCPQPIAAYTDAGVAVCESHFEGVSA